MKNILVPTDFSACADNALDSALKLAEKAHAQVIVVHIIDLTGTVYVDYSGPAYDLITEFRDQAERNLENIKTRVAQSQYRSILTFLYEGNISEGILNAASIHHAELIVMGTKGAGNIREKLWGTQAAWIIGKSSIPVFAVPAEYHWKTPSKILLATNHFEKDASSCTTMTNMVDLFGSTLHVIVFTNDEKDKAVTAISHNWDMNRYKEFLDEHYHHHVTTEHLYGNDFGETVEEYIETNHIDMLVMFSYKRSFLDRLFNPSQTKQMSYHTKVPLLTIPAAH